MITSEQFTEKWLLLPDEQPLLANRTAHGRIGMAIFLKFFQMNGHFPVKREDIPKEALEYMAIQIGVSPDAWYDLAWEGPTVNDLERRSGSGSAFGRQPSPMPKHWRHGW